MMIRILLSLALLILTGCDPDRHDKCEWYLVPEPDHIETVKKGWVSLCARNYHNNKQRCFIQAKIDFAEKVYGKAFRFTSLKLDDQQPANVLSVKICTPDKPAAP